MICIDYASFKGVNTFSANHEVHVSSRFEHDGYRVWNSSEVWVLFRVLGVIFCDGERLVPGPWRDILWRWASCTGWSSIREVSLLLRVQMVYRNVSRARWSNCWQRKSNSVLYRRLHFWGQNTLWHEICKTALENFFLHEFVWYKEPFLRTMMWKPKAILLGVFWKLYVNLSFPPVRSSIQTTCSTQGKLRLLD